MAVISDEQKDRIIKLLEERGAKLPCPRCSNDHFTLLDGYLKAPVQENISGLKLGGAVIPSIVTFCNRCGFISQHAMGVLGLIPDEQKSNDE